MTGKLQCLSPIRTQKYIEQNSTYANQVPGLAIYVARPVTNFIYHQINLNDAVQCSHNK